MSSTKLTSYDGYNVNDMKFSKPENGSVPNSIPKISFQRIKIGTKYQDGSMGDLILSTPPGLFSFGLQENREMGTGNVNGYVLPICLWNKNGASAEEKAFTDKFNEIVDRCKKHLLDSKEEIERYELDMSDLKNFNPLYWKKEKGKIVEGAGPVIYTKLMMSKKTEKISTMFINQDTNEEMSPFDVMNRYCYVQAAFKFESIFIGNKMSLQLKLYEVLVKPMDMERRTLLASNVIRRSTDAKIDGEEEQQDNMFDALASNVKTTPSPITTQIQTQNRDAGSIAGDDDDDESEDEEESDEEEDGTPTTPPAPTQPTPPPPVAPKKATTTATRKGGRQTKT